MINVVATPECVTAWLVIHLQLVLPYRYPVINPLILCTVVCITTSVIYMIMYIEGKWRPPTLSLCFRDIVLNQSRLRLRWSPQEWPDSLILSIWSFNFELHHSPISNISRVVCMASLLTLSTERRVIGICCPLMDGHFWLIGFRIATQRRQWGWTLGIPFDTNQNGTRLVALSRVVSPREFYSLLPLASEWLVDGTCFAVDAGQEEPSNRIGSAVLPMK